MIHSKTLGVRVNPDSDAKLSQSELQFITYLVETGIPSEAYRKLIDWELSKGIRKNTIAESSIYPTAMRLLQRPEVQKEYWKQMKEIQAHNVADATEVMMYFTQVMRGELKDQFGLDASLADRTTAAKELAKRTIDLENRIEGKPDAVVEITLNWKRKKGDV